MSNPLRGKKGKFLRKTWFNRLKSAYYNLLNRLGI